jgi:hypothetical protein
MDHAITAIPFAVAMFAGMLICLDIGRRLGKSALARDAQLMSTHGAVDSAVFSLYGLLLAFTFSGAPARLDARRHLIADEANTIVTAYLRLDLLSSESQPAMREQFRQYLDSRLQVYQKLPHIDAAKLELARSAELQTKIWSQAIADTRLPGCHPEAGKLLLPALNQMIETTTKRTMALRIHPPTIIFGLLFLLALVCSLLAGYGMAVSRQRSWVHILAFSLVAVITVFVILEIEYPRTSFLSVETRYDQVLVDLRASMQ